MLGWQPLWWGAVGRWLGVGEGSPGSMRWGRGCGCKNVEGPKKKRGGVSHPRSWVQEAAGHLGLGSRESCFQLDS